MAVSIIYELKRALSGAPLIFYSLVLVLKMHRPDFNTNLGKPQVKILFFVAFLGNYKHLGQIISEQICGVLKFSKKASKYC